jgi:hypothetical protein
MWPKVLYLSAVIISFTFQTAFKTILSAVCFRTASVPMCLVHSNTLYGQCLMKIVCVLCWMKCQSDTTLNTDGTLCCLFNVIQAVLYTYTRGICFCIAVWGVFVFWPLYNTEIAAVPLYYCCVYSKKMSPSEVKFPCDITLAELWNSSYVVLTIKCVLILIMVHFLSLCKTKYEMSYTQLMDNVCDIKYSVFLQTYCSCSSIINFSQCDFPINVSVLNVFWCRIWGAHRGEDS